MRTHSRVYTFRTRETRTGPGALYTPGTAVPTRPGSIPDRRLPHLSGMSLSSRQNPPSPGIYASRGISKGFLAVAPPVHSPRLWPPSLERRPSGLSRELRT